MNVWKKIGGKWAVLGPDVIPFGTVDVTNRSGEVKTVDLGDLAGVAEWDGGDYDFAFPRESQSQSQEAQEAKPAGSGSGKPLTRNIWRRFGNEFVVIGPDIGAGKTVQVASAGGRSKQVRIVKTSGTMRHEGCSYPVGFVGEAQKCAECGKGGNLVEDAGDGLMKHYRCCESRPEVAKMTGDLPTQERWGEPHGT